MTPRCRLFDRSTVDMPGLHVQAHAPPQVVDYPAHNYSLFILGVLILWFGWYGFNPGSETAILGAGTSNPVAVAAVATTLAPCASGLTALFVKAMIVRFRTGTRYIFQHCTGCVPAESQARDIEHIRRMSPTSLLPWSRHERNV